MKKTFQISLGKMLFTIEEDAYEQLCTYLSSLRNQFASTPNGSDIIDDVESRIAEQFMEEKKEIITATEVAQMISLMGTFESTESGEIPSTTIKTSLLQKKLYRNPEDALIAGVCSGIGIYFDMDATLVRIIFAVITFFSGLWIGLVAYILLYFIIPEADTRVKKLQMEGKTITLETIKDVHMQDSTVIDMEKRSRISTKMTILIAIAVLCVLCPFIVILFMGAIISDSILGFPLLFLGLLFLLVLLLIGAVIIFFLKNDNKYPLIIGLLVLCVLILFGGLSYSYYSRVVMSPFPFQFSQILEEHSFSSTGSAFEEEVEENESGSLLEDQSASGSVLE